MHSAIYVALAILFLILLFKMNEHLVTNNPQLISSYNEVRAYPNYLEYADRIKLPYMYF